jgi:GxxExxY protein
MMKSSRKQAQDTVRHTGMSLALLNYARHAMRVLGTGHSERVYHRALATSLGRSNIAFRSELVTPIIFQGEVVGMGRADLVIQGSPGVRPSGPDLVVEIKANSKLPSQASGQLRKYLESLRTVERRECVGVVLNFNQNNGQVEMHVEPANEPKTKPNPVKLSRFFAPETGKRPNAEPSVLHRLQAARAEVRALEREAETLFRTKRARAK